MVVINQQLPDEGVFFSNAMEEVVGTFEEAVTVKRFVSVSGGNDAGGVAATVTYANIQSMANITEVTVQEIAFSNGFYSTGDLHAEFRLQVLGEESYAGDGQSAGRRADQVIYRGRIYKIKGHVMPVNQDGIQFYKATLSQVG